jgi:hypothetical protein
LIKNIFLNQKQIPCVVANLSALFHILLITNSVYTKFLLLSYRQSEGLSGRTLRKIPFLAHAYYIQVPQVSLEDFLKAMHKAVIKQLSERKDFS